jgi:2-dehydropantoate 2-reductase
VNAPAIIVAGAGALGSLFGGLLAEAGRPVTLLARRATHVEAIRRHGLLIVGEGGDRRVAVAATTDLAELPMPGIVLFFCKAMQTPDLAAALAPLWARAHDAVAISFQNGLGNEGAIAAALGPGAVLGGVTPMGATLEAPGVVRNYTTLPSQLGELAGGLSERAARVARVLDAPALPMAASADIMAQKWRKLLLNVALSATSAATRLPIGAVLAVPELAACARRAMDEAAVVAAATGVALPAASRAAVFDAIVHSGAARNKTSMCRDIEAGRPTEVEAIYGAVIGLGEAHGIATPTLATLAAIVRGLERAE